MDEGKVEPVEFKEEEVKEIPAQAIVFHHEEENIFAALGLPPNSKNAANALIRKWRDGINRDGRTSDIIEEFFEMPQSHQAIIFLGMLMREQQAIARDNFMAMLAGAKPKSECDCPDCTAERAQAEAQKEAEQK